MKLRLRELSERTARFFEDLDSARDRAAITQKELNNRLSGQMNKAMYVSLIVAAIFLTLRLLTGLLGINVGGFPDLPGSNVSAAEVFTKDQGLEGSVVTRKTISQFFLVVTWRPICLMVRSSDGVQSTCRNSPNGRTTI